MQLYNWVSYLNPAVVKDFERAYGVNVAVTTFDTMDEAVAKLASNTAQFDVFWPEVPILDELVAGKVLQPLNHSYLPNLAANIWPRLQSPWYDQHARYTIPYGVWTTGIAWRKDHLPWFTPSTMRNPYDIFWDPRVRRIAGRVAFLDDERDCIGQVLVRNGIRDVNTVRPAYLERVQSQILDLVRSLNLKFTTTDYSDIPQGAIWLRQAWSGDMINARYYLPKGTSVNVIGYWSPTDGRGPVNNDTIAIVRGGSNPVLAHHFLNYMLNYDVAVKNFSFTGYPPPQIRLNLDAVVGDGIVPRALSSALVTPVDVDHGYQEGTLTVAGQQLWENTWAAILAGG